MGSQLTWQFFPFKKQLHVGHLQHPEVHIFFPPPQQQQSFAPPKHVQQTLVLQQQQHRAINPIFLLDKPKI
ncbi:hypothetical protein L1987_67164 [Smallanthus sonchifolius]|uniref:Uncharacterized protein n=1 Tax=Smallanthus sonchifolius TaxID=185202 RepID=A0ACB9BZF6_9ASTR|nr:hypothetical protein L1987_67164 [Smallanthus sonchifolius]